MDDAFGVRGFESVGDLDGQGEQFVYFEGLAAQHLTESLAFEELHDDEVLALVLLDGVNGADIGVIEGGGGASFALEAFEELGILSHGLR